MRIGIGTYALFWEWNERNPRPLSTAQQIDRAAELGCEVFQICDDPTVATLDDDALRALAKHATSRGIELELGTRGTDPDHLCEWIRKAELLGARTLRSMVLATEIADGAASVVSRLTGVLPELTAADVALALETYEQVRTDDLVAIVQAVATPRVGICLDPANCVSALEHPMQVIEATGGLVTNLHVKDFAFTRNPGWVGFLYAGARLGEGLLDLDAELSAVYGNQADSLRAETTDGRPSPSAIVEHWVPWQGDIDSTLALERNWTDTTLAELRRRRQG